MLPLRLSDTSGGMHVAANLAADVLTLLDAYPILLLKGDLGSGKTTFSQMLLKQAGLEESVTSPTFNLVSEYRLPDGRTVYHFDLYRIKHAEELHELGFMEYLDSGQICIIEWPEIAEGLIPPPYLSLQLFHNDEQRRYVLEKHELKA